MNLLSSEELGNIRGSIVVVVEEALTIMFKSINCMAVEASNPGELVDTVDKYARRDDVAIILVQRDLAEPVMDDIEKIMDKTGKIISYIPSPRSPGEPVDMRALLMKALGFG